MVLFVSYSTAFTANVIPTVASSSPSGADITETLPVITYRWPGAVDSAGMNDVYFFVVASFCRHLLLFRSNSCNNKTLLASIGPGKQ